MDSTINNKSKLVRDLSSLGIIQNLARSFTTEQSLDIFRRICITRYFELKVCESIEKKFITCPTFLSIGQESISAAVSSEFSDCLIFAQHRAHSVYLSFGGDPIKLRDELLGKETGCSGGRGGSSQIQELDIGMIGHQGFIGENIPLAVGAALGNPNKRVVCFFGDAAVEEDYALTSMGFAITHKLPVLFICEDNGLSILTPTKVRRTWEVSDVTASMGIPSVDITDDPWLIVHHVRKFSNTLPAYINCRTCRHRWHTGVGIDGPPNWDRFALVKKQLEYLKLLKEAQKIEKRTKQYMDKLWE